jgi:hypothetical protein
MIGEPQELVLSDRVTVTVAELDGFELEKAELLMCDLTGANFDPANAGLATMKMAMFQLPVFAKCSIRSLNGQPVNPLANVAEYSRVSKQIGTRERTPLYVWARPIYVIDEDEVKNLVSAQLP